MFMTGTIYVYKFFNICNHTDIYCKSILINNYDDVLRYEVRFLYNKYLYVIYYMNIMKLGIKK